MIMKHVLQSSQAVKDTGMEDDGDCKHLSMLSNFCVISTRLE